jgi:hypothetical protein
VDAAPVAIEALSRKDYTNVSEVSKRHYKFQIPMGIYIISSTISSSSGMLQDVKKVWFSADNILFFWDYERFLFCVVFAPFAIHISYSLLASGEFQQFSGIEGIVMNVKSVPSATSVFTSKVKHVVVRYSVYSF